jgi:AcrR family transcriptional regulator
MARWQPDAQGRLTQAAFELFGERGYDATTVADIAERAGLTRRTFFRYFADKREVLFAGSLQLHDLFVTSVASAPADASPFDTVAVALDAVAATFEERRAFAARRAQIIASTPELQERELIKLASLAAAVAQALRDRGVGEPAASLTGQTAIAVFHVAFGRWMAAGNDRDFAQLIRESLDELRTVAAG